MEGIHRIAIPAGVEIECQEAGSGPRPFVLVHGFTGSRDDWREHMTPLAALGRTLAPDQRGHGGSSNPGDPAGYTLDQLCADLAAALDALDAAPCDLLGHSMGGMVALRYALADPKRVHSLVLMDTAAALEMGEPALQVMEAVGRLARSEGMERIAELLRDAPDAIGGASASAPDAFDSSPDRIRPKLLQMDPEAFATLGPAVFAAESIVDRLGEIRCPTTVIVGEGDAAFRKPSEALADGIEGAELIVIPESAHEPQLQNPRAWRQAVEGHLRGVRGAHS